MKITTTFRHMDPSEALRAYVEEKFGKLERFDDKIVEVHCVLSARREAHRVEVTLQVAGATLRADVESEGMYGSIDLAVDKLSRQLKRHREKRKDQGRRSVRLMGEEAPAAPQPAAEGLIRVRRTFPAKPMFPDDAAMELESSGEEFRVFHNAETNEVNVVYRLPNGGYGIVEPEA